MSTPTLSVKLARETLPLMQDVRRAYVLTHPTLSPSDSAAIAYAVYLVEYLKRNGGKILWLRLMDADFDFGRFALPYAFPRDIRYVTSINRAVIPVLDRGIDSELRPVFGEKVYRNFAIRAFLRAAYCLTHEGFEDVIIVAGDAVPEDAPAAYDPYELLFPNGTNAPLPEELPEDVLDLEIFDRAERARAAADAVTAETGLF